ncbi:hypothetical protein [Dysgonomonas termitidis]|uniref:T9SS C-terminal target domain-containing protein n=1 Tax=Dysgonomonas termitidis TaxID=1516126 RepID=A0ABV9KW57_9BACT
MKKLIFLFVVTIVSALFTGCSNDLTDEGPANVATKATVTIPHNTIITSDVTWSNTNEYILNGKVYVKAPATLTIQAGTTVKGVYNADPELASALIVTRGAKISAIGTFTNPVILTAQNGLEGGWGGLVLLGKAPLNRVDQVIEGINPSVVPSGVDVYYGGGGAGLGDAEDSSGTLRYVRVEYAGAKISEANELNAFTFGGVGRGTTLDHLQAYRGADDAFEFFGGTVDAKYLVSTATDDDAFDFDFGYQGRIQFAVSTIDPSLSYSSDPNGIECDNDGTGSTAEPFTHPTLSNFTITGTQSGSALNALKSAANFRRNAQFTLVNSVLYGFPSGVLKETVNPSTLLNNVVSSTVANQEFNTFTPDVSNLARAWNNLILSSPFGAYRSTALQPTGGAAIDGSYYSHTDAWFTNTQYKGALVSIGANWLTQGLWVR